ncbi:hypothetical protein [Streptomyces sp. NPDC018584]|uniref:hypothetical protein n=1 Tax=unclassified Streptomyces TaxID=2593676 RepID=UPI0037B6D9D3
MTPFVIVLIVGFVLHVAVGAIIRTPEEEHATLRWKTWHSFLTGLLTTGVILAVVVGFYVATHVLLPFWALLLAADLLAAGYRLRRHSQRVQERRAIQSLYDHPSHGEA